jgi:hypothetical protein
VFRRLLQIVSLISLTGLCLLYPVLESLDPWDSKEPSSDAEIQLIAVLTFVGIMFLLAHLLAALAASSVLMLACHDLCRRSMVAFLAFDFTFIPAVTASPPLPLRI